MKDKLKKYLLPNLPYLFFVYLFDKLCQAVRLAPGLDVSEKLLHIGQGFQTAFASSAPSFHVSCVGYLRRHLRRDPRPAGGVSESEKREEISPWR